MPPEMEKERIGYFLRNVNEEERIGEHLQNCKAHRENCCCRTPAPVVEYRGLIVKAREKGDGLLSPMIFDRDYRYP